MYTAIIVSDDGKDTVRTVRLKMIVLVVYKNLLMICLLRVL